MFPLQSPRGYIYRIKRCNFKILQSYKIIKNWYNYIMIYNCRLQMNLKHQLNVLKSSWERWIVYKKTVHYGVLRQTCTMHSVRVHKEICIQVYKCKSQAVQICTRTLECTKALYMIARLLCQTNHLYSVQST